MHALDCAPSDFAHSRTPALPHSRTPALPPFPSPLRGSSLQPGALQPPTRRARPAAWPPRIVGTASRGERIGRVPSTRFGGTKAAGGRGPLPLQAKLGGPRRDGWQVDEVARDLQHAPDVDQVLLGVPFAEVLELADADIRSVALRRADSRTPPGERRRIALEAAVETRRRPRRCRA